MIEPALSPCMSDLTPRQRQVAALVADGLTDKRIGARLNMRYDTVRVHIVALAYRLKIPLGHNTRVLIARWWWGQTNRTV